MVSRRPRTTILTHQDGLPQMLGRHRDLMHESVRWGGPYGVTSVQVVTMA